MKIPFRRESITAIMPKRANPDDAGFDLYADLGLGGTLTIYPLRRALVPTNISMALPSGTYLRVADRSGLALKHGLHVLGGVIDAGYRGGVGVVLFNTGESKVTIKHGERIAQGIVTLLAPVDGFDEVDELPTSVRGIGGFGSSGV